ncbi:MAG: hypothetical protein HC924_06350 [Synechococcaceae cyanobacterium SM2_3_2]|nr:hypothetical protein [Synechococcaceae cyanobacterium SM2_3_2]
MASPRPLLLSASYLVIGSLLIDGLGRGGGLGSPALAQSYLLQGQVVQVIGPTEVLITIDGQLFALNLAYQMVPPEAGELVQQQTTQALSQLLPVDSVVQIDPLQLGSGNRIYGFAYNQNGLVNAQLLASGHTIAPWRLPEPGLQQLYDGAVAQAQALGLGLYAPSQAAVVQAQTASVGQRVWRELRDPSSPLLPSLLGTSLMVVILGVVGVKQWRRSHRPAAAGVPLAGSGDPGPSHDPHRLQKTLAAAIARQKSLQGRYQDLQNQVDIWLEKAKTAILQKDDELARVALIRKRSYAKSAQEMQAELEVATAQVAAIQSVSHRHTISTQMPPSSPLDLVDLDSPLDLD